jgi:hypothetical protein
MGLINLNVAKPAMQSARVRRTSDQRRAAIRSTQREQPKRTSKKHDEQVTASARSEARVFTRGRLGRRTEGSVRYAETLVATTSAASPPGSTEEQFTPTHLLPRDVLPQPKRCVAGRYVGLARFGRQR